MPTRCMALAAREVAASIVKLWVQIEVQRRRCHVLSVKKVRVEVEVGAEVNVSKRSK